jgi:glycerol-3-phosphate dehydrogenase (NAD(P)+)
MTRLGVALGAEKITFQGLSGMGDLILTCSDDLSRNRRFGKELANNVNAEEALKNINATVEGFSALKLVIDIANQLKIEMPICEQVMLVTQGIKTPIDAVNELLLRKTNQE